MNELEKQTLRIIGENVDSPDVFTDTSEGMAPIRDSINDAIEEITILTGGMKRTYKLPLKANAFFYRLKFDIGRLGWITNVWLNSNNTRVNRTDLQTLLWTNPRWLYNRDTPRNYIPIGKDTLCIWPATSAATDMLEIEAVIIPDRYKEDTDRIKLRDAYKWATIHYAVGEWHASVGNAKEALKCHNMYMEKMGLKTGYQEYAERKWGLQTNKTGG